MLEMPNLSYNYMLSNYIGGTKLQEVNLIGLYVRIKPYRATLQSHICYHHYI